MKKKSKYKFPLPMIFGEDYDPIFGMHPIELNGVGYQFIFLGALVIIAAIAKIVWLAMGAG